MRLSKRTLLVGAAAIAATGVGIAMFNSPAQAAVQTGAQAPAFSVRDANGATRTLAEFAGHTVVLEWTSNACPFVSKHYRSQNMQNLQREAVAGGAIWLSVMSDAQGQAGYLEGPGALAWAGRRNSNASAILMDSSGALGRAYGARNTPHMFIINEQGRLVYQGAIDDHPSSNPDSIEGAHNYVRAALADMAAGRPIATAETTPYGCTIKY